MTELQFSTKQPSEPLPTLVQGAAIAMRTGTDHEMVKSIVLLSQYPPSEVVGKLSDCVINALPENKKDTSSYLPVDPNGRLSDDKTMQTVIQAMLKGDQQELRAILVESYDNMLAVTGGHPSQAQLSRCYKS